MGYINTVGCAIDRKYNRVCACFRLLKRGHIGAKKAIELMADRGVDRPHRMIELWRWHFEKNGIHIKP